jgi:hypothetical protein
MAMFSGGAAQQVSTFRAFEFELGTYRTGRRFTMAGKYLDAVGVGAAIRGKCDFVGDGVGWARRATALDHCFQMPYKHSEICRHKIPKSRYRVENWPEYDAALRERGSLTVWVTLEAIATWRPAKSSRRGRSPHYSDIAIEPGAMLRLAFGRPWWQTEGAAALGDDAAQLGHRRSRPYDAVASYRRPLP